MAFLARSAVANNAQFLREKYESTEYGYHYFINQCAPYILLIPRKEAGRTVCKVTPKRECWDFNTCMSAITLMVTLSEASPVVLLFRMGGTLDPINGNSRSDLLILATLVEPWLGKQISRLDKVL